MLKVSFRLPRLRGLVLPLALLLGATGATQAQTLPLDSAVRVGHLPNGLTYYIRANATPAHRAQLLLVNKVGSILENDEQQGLAHFLEHMAFNGTRDYPKNELISFLQKSGVRFGADLNAHTGFDETVFELPIPTDQPGLLKQGVNILANWAGRITLDTKEIDQERGIILEEARLRGKNAGERLRRQTFPAMLNRSHYADRIPIGTEDIIKNFPAERIRQFYHDWYRPDLQAVVAVGDFDPNQVEAYIKEYFGDLKNPATERPLPSYPLPARPGTEVVIATDVDLAGVQASAIVRQPAAALTTANDLRTLFRRQLFGSLLNARLAEVLRKPNPPYQGASVGFEDLVSHTEALTLNLTVAQPADLRAGLAALVGEVDRVRRLGFTPTELARAKASLAATFTQSWQERSKTPSASYASEYEQLFLKGTAAAGVATERRLATQYLQDMQPAELSALAAEFLRPDNRLLLLQAPTKDKAQLPSAATLTQWFVPPATPLPAYEDADATTGPAAPLVVVPAGGSIVRETPLPTIGATELLLSNGVRVVLKPTSNQNNEILLGSYAYGGTSVASDADFTSASLAAPIVQNSGVGEFSLSRLSKLLAGRTVALAPQIGELTQGFGGRSSVPELETALQLVYLYSTQPRRDTVAWATSLARLKTNLANKSSDPQRIFSDTIAAVLNRHNFRRLTPTISRVEQARQGEALAFYKARYGTATGSTFILVGNLDPATVKPLLARYLGALPTKAGALPAFRDLHITPPTGPLTTTVRQGTEDKASVRLTFQGADKYSLASQVQLKALSDVLELRLLERLREQEGGVYSPSVQAGYTRLPTGRYSLTVQFGCAPQNVDKLIKATLEETAALAAKGATPTDLEKVLAEARADYQRQGETNGYWLGYLLDQYRNHDDPAARLAQPQLLSKVSAKSTQAAAKRYLNPQHLLRFVLLPAGAAY